MKIAKVLLIVVLTVLLLIFASVLVGCNKQILDLDYRFTHVHIYETGECYEIKSWRDYDDSDQIQVTLADGAVLVLHSSSCALVKGDCPLCKDKKNRGTG